jgi:hypothetical protein
MLVLGCILFAAETSMAASSRCGRNSRSATARRTHVSPKIVTTKTYYQKCTDGTSEPIATVTTFSNTVGSQTVTTTVVATRQASIGCLAESA